MKTFSEELRHRYPTAEFEAVERLLDQAEAAKLPVNRAIGVSPLAKTPHKTRDLFQAGLRRNLELAAGFVQVFNAGFFIPLFVLSRASVETGALLLDFWRKVSQIVASRDKASLACFDQKIRNAILGAKSKAWVVDPNQWPAPNVKTILDNHLTKAGYSGLWDYYEILCEYAHPNWAGMHAAYCRVDEAARETHYIDRPAEMEFDGVPVAVNALDIGLRMTLLAVEEYEKKLAEFTRLCEEALREKNSQWR